MIARTPAGASATLSSPAHISSLIVAAHPAAGDALKAALTAMPGVQIHAVAADGRLIVTLETESDQATVQLFETIHQLPDVLSAAMVYHQYETDPDEEA